MSSDGGLASFYSDKNIFITGGSGFLGVCLLEKILRTIPKHGDVYLLMRPKRGKQIQERLETIKTNSVFEELLKEKSAEEVRKKIKTLFPIVIIFVFTISCLTLTEITILTIFGLS